MTGLVGGTVDFGLILESIYEPHSKILSKSKMSYFFFLLKLLMLLGAHNVSESCNHQGIITLTLRSFAQNELVST